MAGAQIFKYVLEAGDNEVDMPVGAEVLAVVLSTSGPALVALVDPEAEHVTRHFHVVGNGVDLPEGVGSLHYRGTAKYPGAFTAHVFETTAVKATA